MSVRDIPCEIGDLKFPPERDRPEVSSSVDTPTTEIDTLDTDPVVQQMGPGALQYDFHGEVFTKGANYLTNLRRTEYIKIIHRRTGTFLGMVKSVDVDSTNTRNRIRGEGSDWNLKGKGGYKDYRHEFDLTVSVVAQGDPPVGAEIDKKKKK